MRVAGVGFRTGATADSLRDALQAAGGGAEALATAGGKAGSLRVLAGDLGLPVIAIAPELLARQAVLTRSRRVTALFGTGSLAEAAALAAAGPGARLLGPRRISADGKATAAIAEGSGE